jgi:hypothetical protein
MTMALLSIACTVRARKLTWQCLAMAKNMCATLTTLEFTHCSRKSEGTSNRIEKKAVALRHQSSDPTHYHVWKKHAHPPIKTSQSGSTTRNHGRSQLELTSASYRIPHSTPDISRAPSAPRGVMALPQPTHRLLLSRSTTIWHLPSRSREPLFLPTLSYQPNGAFST